MLDLLSTDFSAPALKFGKAEDLLTKLLELSKAAANDYQTFRVAAGGR